MNKLLKVAIINWLLQNEKTWNRINACTENFKEYIYNKEGNFLIGGKETHNFIKKADELIYGSDE